MASQHEVRRQSDDGTVLVGPSALAELARIGFLDPSVVRGALQDGAAGARSAMVGFPRTYAGTRMWAETTASLAVVRAPGAGRWKMCQASSWSGTSAAV